MRPWRHVENLAARVRRARRQRAGVSLILMYHRVSTPSADPWRLNVTPEHFSEHLDVIRRVAHPVPLATIASDVRGKRVSAPRQVAITFDDGYANNLFEAAPRLAAAGVPGTVFVTTAYVGARDEYWWDVLERIVLHARALPSTLELTLPGGARRWQLGTAAEAGQDVNGTAEAAPVGTRLHFYRELWAALTPLTPDSRQPALDALAAWAGSDIGPRESHRPVTLEELTRLASHPQIEIGAHTVTHPKLTQVSPADQRRELVDSRAQLEAMTGRTVAGFCYPSGEWSPAVRAIAQEAGYQYATTVDGEPVWAENDPLSLPRVMVEDWDGDELARRLDAWFAS